MKLLIAGAGIRGKRLLLRLRNYKIETFAFLDNNLEMQKTGVEGKACYSIDYFKDTQREYVVMVSPESATELMEQVAGIYSNVLDLKLTDLLLKSPFDVGYEAFYPIGHFYSLYPDISNLKEGEDVSKLDSAGSMEIEGVDLNKNVQKQILDKMMKEYRTILNWSKMGEESQYRYKRGNQAFIEGDALALFSMIKVLRPKRWIEVGSGFSSALLLDTNEYCMNNEIEIKFIEPYADLLKTLLKETDKITLYEKGLEEVDLSVFKELQAGDVLFIDSTHVSKYGSDVNYLFFHILPILNPGVYIHLHDIFFPFEYPHEWLRTGFVLNELYLLRSFLQYNDKFEVIYFQNYLEKNYRKEIEEAWPFEEKNIHGGSFWMRKKE